jgi:hypothetical protein
MTRRKFLERGGALTLAAASSAVALERLLEPAAAAGPLSKCISLGGPGSLRQDGHPDDYRVHGNREFIRDYSDTTWVKLWVSWYDLQQELGASPAGRTASWKHLNGAPGGAAWLRRLDGQLQAVNHDGLRAIITIHHTFPTWANGATGTDPVSLTKPREQKLPLDRSPDGPWAWFVSHLLARYRPGTPPNPLGPHEPEPGENTSGYDPRAGNPSGAWIDALEILNEPNHLGWPQEGVEQAAAQMIRSAASLAQAHGPTTILAPATSDYPDADSSNTRGYVGREWYGFTRRVLDELAGFTPPVPVRWSHHNYRDVRLEEQPTRVERVAGLLRGAAWPGGPQSLWLTESGLNMSTSWSTTAARLEQARKIERNFHRMMAAPDVFMWTQHTISDKQGNSWKGGLRDDFTAAAGPGKERPSWYAWQSLPGAPSQ